MTTTLATTPTIAPPLQVLGRTGPSNTDPCYRALPDGPRFGDQVWSLSAVAPTAKASSSLDFDKVPETFRVTVKELCYALLNVAPRRGARPLKPLTVYAYFRHLSTFAAWAADRGHTRFATLTIADTDEYLRQLQASEGNSTNLNRQLRAIAALYDYRAFLTEDALSFAPWDGKDATKTSGRRNPNSAENRTERIPEELSGPLLSWALFYTQTVASELLAEIRGEPYEVTIDPSTGQPWRRPYDGYARTKTEEETLRSACMIVILMLTGMRFREAVSIRRGAVTKLRDIPGGVPLFELKARTFKSIPSPHGKEATWVTVEPAAQAVAILEQLTPTGEHIFVPRWIDKPEFFGPGKLTVNLNGFQRNINRYHATDGRPGIPTTEDGQPQPITSRQFRRTLAAYIAAQPFGIVAGMLQYKHVQVATFEGYAGTSESGFKIEVRQQEELARYQDIIETYEDAVAGTPTAGGHASLVRREVGGFTGQVVDEARLQTMARAKATSMHVGELNDCFFDPDKAMCRTALKQVADAGPLFSQCAPLECTCSLVGHSKLPAWERLAAQWDDRHRDSGSELQSRQAEAQARIARSVVVQLTTKPKGRAL